MTGPTVTPEQRARRGLRLSYFLHVVPRPATRTRRTTRREAVRSLLWFVARSSLRLTTPEANLRSYTFNKQVIKHRFCANCGVHPFGEGVDAKGNATAAVNIRCLEDVDLEAIPVNHFDGRSV